MVPISIVAFGRDSVTMSMLMNEFGAYAQRFYTPSGDLKTARSHRNGTFVEANSLLMATHGICFIGDWSIHNASCSAYVKNGKLLEMRNSTLKRSESNWFFIFLVSSGLGTNYRRCTNECRFPTEMCRLVALVLLWNEKGRRKCDDVFKVNAFVSIQVPQRLNLMDFCFVF